MPGHGEKRSRTEEAAISALLCEPNIAAAAKRAGVGQATLRRWLQDRDFSERYRAARRQVLEQATARLQRAATDAVDALQTIVSDTDAPVSSRVSAARTILNTAYRATEVEDLSERLLTIEAAMEVMKS